MQSDPTPPPSIDVPPPLPPEKSVRKSTARPLLVILLNLCLGLFVADAVVSLADDSLILFLGARILRPIRALTFLFSFLVTMVIYVLMGVTPMIPKRVFLPVTLFAPASMLVMILCSIYFLGRAQQIVWVISFFQVVLGLGLLRLCQGDLKMQWPLLREDQLDPRGFTWRNLLRFAALNLFVLLPAVVLYLALCASLAVDHFTDGFLALRRSGLNVQVRKYVRNDSKTIQLFPMSHIGESAFYNRVSQSFPTNSVILMEGVSDDRHLLTNKISYRRMAHAIGVAEQQKEFRPIHGEMIRADIDVEEFATNTIDFINLVMLVHTKGLNRNLLLHLMQYAPAPGFEQQLFNDLLRKRNRRLVEEIRAQLAHSDNIMVPWGAAHMPEIAREIQKLGFRLEETQEYAAIRFGARAH